jgi:hypothetical protein
VKGNGVGQNGKMVRLIIEWMDGLLCRRDSSVIFCITIPHQILKKNFLKGDRDGAVSRALGCEGGGRRGGEEKITHTHVPISL